ncbi:MAG: phosphatidate cytidylyltransferase, partial [Gemmatimonadota bacterium]
FLMLAAGSAAARVPPREGPMTAAALTGFGALYTGGTLAFSVPLREELASGRLEGTLLFFFPVTVTWLADTAAYLAGKRWGRRQLAPDVSPNKTWTGAFAGVGTAVVGAGLYGTLLLPLAGGGAASPGLVASLLLGLVVGAAGIGGDLSISILKRECGVKDSSQLIPGHGGMLDRLDALLWVFPLTYVFLLLA